MRRGRWYWRMMVLGLLLVLADAGGNRGVVRAARAQSMRPDLRQGVAVDAPLDQDPVFKARRARLLNEDRQKKLVEDTNKLLDMVRKLNAEVKAKNQEAFTQEQSAQLVRIEKLAHRVKDRMIESEGDLPWQQIPLSPLQP